MDVILLERVSRLGQMGLSEDVLRFLTIKVEAHEEGPSAMMQKREERSERGGFGDRDRGDRPPRSFGDAGADRGPRRPREGFEGGAE